MSLADKRGERAADGIKVHRRWRRCRQQSGRWICHRSRFGAPGAAQNERRVCLSRTALLTHQTLLAEFTHAASRAHLSAHSPPTRCPCRPHVPFLARGKVVNDVSATLGYHHEQVDIINADHRGMCRFQSSGDPGYKKVRNALQTCLRRQPGQYSKI